MLRLLGFIFLVFICVGTAPWGLVFGSVLCIGWLVIKPSQTHRFPDEKDRVSSTQWSFSAIPLLNAVYCANCDLITNSPHDECKVCGSHSVIGVSRLWQLTLGQEPVKAAKYKVSLTADIREIPANGLSESTKLINRLAELGGNVKLLHIQVQSVDDAISNAKMELIKPALPITTDAWQKAS
jgi:hypothetical protein